MPTETTCGKAIGNELKAQLVPPDDSMKAVETEQKHKWNHPPSGGCVGNGFIWLKRQA
jgi:hypothetical protein